jgi:hypothetical protein
MQPQNVTVYANVTQDELSNNNFVLFWTITPVPSSLDTGKLIVTFLAIFSFIFVIYNFFKPKEGIIQKNKKYSQPKASDAKKLKGKTLKL